jgi:uncharacterized delta-60 repeat protein
MFKPNRRRTILGRAWASATIASLLCFSLALAASGGLDPSFHGNGKLKMDIIAGQYNDARAVAIQPDGKIVAVGDTDPSATNFHIAIARFTTKGALDITFNGTGKKVTDLGGIDQGLGVVIDKSTGKIIVAGQKCSSDGSTCDVAVLRYTKNGSLDTSFRGSGYRIDDYGGGDNGSYGAVALQSDGKIVVGGYMYNTTSKNYDFAIYRYTSMGALDTTFNGTGKKAIPFAAGKNDFIFGLVIQPADGKIIVAGDTCDSNYTNCDFALARLNPNGSLDTSFNKTGKQTTDLGGNDIASGIALQSNGKIVLAGQKGTATSTNFALARYNTNGNLDTSFAGTGKKVFDFSGSGKANRALAVSIQPTTGKIVACGSSNGNFALARLTSAGALDTTFNSTGKVSIDFGGNDSCRGLAIQPAAGKYVLAGYTDDGTKQHWALAMVLP